MTRRRNFLLPLLVLVLAVCWVSTAPLLAARLIVEQPLERVDAIFVLGGSAAYKQRAEQAAMYYTSGISARILLSDDGERAGWSQAEQTNLPFIELARRELVRQGVPPDAIIQLPGEQTGTQSEAETLASVADELQIRSVLIVTSPYHTRRAVSTFRKIMPGLTIGIASTPLGRESPQPDWWWIYSSGWRDVGAEYVKSLGYWLFY